MQSNPITVHLYITFEIRKSRKILLKIRKDLEESTHLSDQTKKTQIDEYEINVTNTRKITSLHVKIDLTQSTLLLKIPLQKFIPSEIRAIQHCIYERFGDEAALSFIQNSSTKTVSITGQLITSSRLTKMFVMTDSKSKVIHADNFVKLENQYFTKEITCENHALPTNKNLRRWNIEILNQPKQHNIQIAHKRSKAVHEKISLVFECDYTKIIKSNKDNMIPGIRVNLPLQTPFSWISFIKSMPSYPHLNPSVTLMK